MKEDIQPLIDLHIAEYNALTARNTQWSVIQSTAWMLLLIGLSLTLTILTFKHEAIGLVIWAGGLVVQGAFMGICFATHQIYRNVNYLESDLRPKIQALIAQDGVWQYEQFLFDKSGRKPSQSDSVPTLIGIVALGLIVVYLPRYAHRLELWAGIGLNIIFVFILVYLTKNVIAERRKFERVLAERISTPIPVSADLINQAFHNIQRHIKRLKDANVITPESFESWQTRAASLRAEITHTLEGAMKRQK